MCTPCWKQVAIKDIWLCMKCMYPSGGTVKLRENSFKNFTQDFIEAVDRIANLLSRPIILNVQPTSKFFGTGRVDSRSFLVDIVLRARCLNVVATIKSRVWRTIWSLTKSPGNIPHTGSLRNSIWAIIEKQLCRERMLLLCAMDPKRVADINRITEDDTIGRRSPADHDKYINAEMPKVYSDASAAGSDVVGGIIGEESEWKDIQFAMKDPEPEYDPTDYWLRGNRNIDRLTAADILLPFLCEHCRKGDYSPEWKECAASPRMCVNCNYNFWCRNNELHSISQETEEIWESALRVRILWESCPDWKEVLPASDLRKFMIEGSACPDQEAGTMGERSIEERTTPWRYQSRS